MITSAARWILLLTCTAVPAPAQVQAEAGPELHASSLAFQTAEPVTSVRAQPASGASGLPQRPPPPRTMEAQWPVFAVFTVVWIAIVGYILTFNARLKRLVDAVESSGTSDSPGRSV